MHPVEILLYVLIALAAIGIVIAFGSKAVEAIRRDVLPPRDPD
jgi:hypothetical protein